MKNYLKVVIFLMFFVIACSSDGADNSNNNSNGNSEVIVPSNLTLDISIVGQNDYSKGKVERIINLSDNIQP